MLKVAQEPGHCRTLENGNTRKAGKLGEGGEGHLEQGLVEENFGTVLICGAALVLAREVAVKFWREVVHVDGWKLQLLFARLPPGNSESAGQGGGGASLCISLLSVEGKGEGMMSRSASAPAGRVVFV